MLSKSDLETMMVNLAGGRPVFHSEADFQHALAWRIYEFRPDLLVRLELPLARVGEVDIVLVRGAERFLVELKYKTVTFSEVIDGETFDLKSHVALPLGRYDGWKDVARIERSGLPGVTIFLTNDPAYWRAGDHGNGVDFSLKNGRELSAGDLAWKDNSNTKSIGVGRVSSIKIRGNYTLEWVDYGSAERGFKFLLNMVDRIDAAYSGRH